ncbi:MAG TPA: lipid II flippase MurJ, partial [Chloroflexota bacterium]|nr:lipid II flippase MurJ [Chloroflexota bacterium]
MLRFVTAPYYEAYRIQQAACRSIDARVQYHHVDMSAHTTAAPPNLTVSLSAVRRRPVLSATAILMVAFLASRVLGMLRQILFTAVFALGPESSAFYTAFRAPDLIFNLISGGALTSAFLPTFAGYLARRTRHAEDEAWRVANTIFYLTMLILLPVLVLGIILAPMYVPLLVQNPDLRLQQATIDQAVPLTRIMLLQPLFMALVSICQGIANSYMRFTVPALAPLVYNISIIVGILLGAHFGIIAVGWAVTVGAALQFAVQIPWLPHGRRLLHFSLDLGSRG